MDNQKSNEIVNVDATPVDKGQLQKVEDVKKIIHILEVNYILLLKRDRKQ